MERIELTCEGGQSKSSQKNSNHKGAFETNNGADEGKIIILDNKRYKYVKCSHVIKNVIENRHANVNRAQPIRRKRLIHGETQQDDLDHTRNKRLNKIPTKHEKSTPATSSHFNHVSEYIVKKEVKEEGHDGKCNKLHEKNISDKVEKKNSDDDTSMDVEILDSDGVIKLGTSSAFVPSTIYRSEFGVSKASSDYREKVLSALEKPFDKTEYRTLSEEVKHYLAKYPDLKEKLAEYRYKKLTRMTILRGFFYWLVNVMHDEAFQPWKDSQCLAVLPGYVQEN